MFNVGDKVVYVGDDYKFDKHEVAEDNRAHGVVTAIDNDPTRTAWTMYAVAFDNIEEPYNELYCYTEELMREEAAKETEPVTS